MSQGANMLLMHFYVTLLEQAHRLSILLEPPPEVDMEMIHSSPSIVQFVARGRVFRGAAGGRVCRGVAEDYVEGPNLYIENVSPLESPRVK